MADLSRTPVTLIGASRGLGRVLAETFHRLGAQVLVVARGQAGLDAVARDLPGVAVLACDASAADAPDRMFAVQAHRCAGAGKGRRRNRRSASPGVAGTARFMRLSISYAARG
jgi:NAD(P)-dependent dehydrogenase (short-subunit alcohol dehydrogenase family)